ncbi:MAG: hypothetical protein AAGA30_07665 [Planctomycetota bacterium]
MACKIHALADEGRLEEVEALLRQQPELINTKDAMGNAAIHYASG